MNRHTVQLIARGAINQMGNMLYDYGNSVWLASNGDGWKTVLGIYRISELVTSILVNPFGGVISDRFSPSQDFDDDRPGVWTPLFGDFFIRNDRLDDCSPDCCQYCSGHYLCIFSYSQQKPVSLGS